jgi:N-acetylneuraminic acid mutarotase
VLAFDPTGGRVTRIGRLPRALTHATAATFGGTVYVFGGRGDALDSATAAIWAVDPRSGRVRRAGRLPLALSDMGAVALSDSVLLVGGRDRSGRARDEVMRVEMAR